MEAKKIAIFTDAHSLLEPVEAIINDAKKEGIDEIYSLGDNIGVGPNPKEVMDLIEENNIMSLAGNYEDTIDFGVDPFLWYMSDEAVKNMQWTKAQLAESQVKNIKAFPHFKELQIGGKKIALCHFANDVRAEFNGGNCWSYQYKLERNIPAYEQFYYTNSKKNLDDLAGMLRINKRELKHLDNDYERMLYMKKYVLKNVDYYLKHPNLLGCVSNVIDPIFLSENSLNTVKDYDAIIQGHVHFKYYENADREYYTIRGAGIGDSYKNRDLASYVILQETPNGFEVIERKPQFDYEKMKHSIMNCPDVDQRILKYTHMR